MTVMSPADRPKIAVVRTADRITRFAIGIARRLFFQRFEPRRHEKRIRRILVYRIGNIGDVVVAFPTLAVIRARFPDADICLLTSPGKPGAPGAADLAALAPWFDSIIEYHGPDVASWRGLATFLKRLRRERFELFVELSNVIAPPLHVFRDLLLARLIGCRFAVGFEPRTIRRFLRQQVLHLPQRRESDRLFDSLAGELDLPAQWPIRLVPVSTDQAAVAEKLAQAGVQDGTSFVVVHVGGKRPTNQWFPDRFAAVADHVQQRYDMRVILTGSPAERDLVRGVTEHMRTDPAVLCGELTVSELAALLAKAVLYIGNDTGPMHLAAALGTPTVSIFSARDFPDQWFPYGDNHIVLREDVPCSPCFRETCDVGLVCLDRITLDRVQRAVDVQLARRGLQQTPEVAYQ